VYNIFGERDGDLFKTSISTISSKYLLLDSLYLKYERQEEKTMNSQKKRIQQLTLAAFFVAIEVIMSVTPIGYIPVGALSITTMHLPVILAGVLLGPEFGAGIGFVFGLTSCVRATMQPGITSFVFTPFVQVGNMHGNAFSLLIAFGPRILLGYLSGMMYRFIVRKTNNKALSATLSAALNTIIHTLLVLGGIWVFFAQPYADALNITTGALAIAFFTTITTNGILETVLAAIVVPVLTRALRPAAERMGIKNE